MKNEKINENFETFSEPAVRRLPIYYHYLSEIKRGGVTFISSTKIASDLNLLQIQVRKDLEMTGLAGKPKVGYEIEALIKAIESFLGWNKISPAILVGAGHFGNALLGYGGFCEYGLNIAAAFDNDFLKIGKFIHGKPVFSTDSMEKYIKEHRIEIGILTVPAQYAQELADKMINAGIKAVWNFAPARITSTNPDIVIQHENLVSSFAVLLKKKFLKNQ